eukprot:TRINITY_DN6533_c0_g2_i1.p1 TRINITY_DN6533_c0_g2~~TRINITY_DN6533_c0_g2_i1.p1  ORF type:complete len:758 (+),score=173.38 TRINITY_DN6533_c0_g2_i1:50-2323(+)
MVRTTLNEVARSYILKGNDQQGEIPELFVLLSLLCGAFLLFILCCYEPQKKDCEPEQDRHQSKFCSEDVALEDGIEVGSAVIAKLKHSWTGDSPYMFGKVQSLSPLVIANTRGMLCNSKDIDWVILATDDGWLGPFDLDWQEPGRYILMQLINGEWVSARVASDHNKQPVKDELLTLKLEPDAGLHGLTSVTVQNDLAFIFTPHVECQGEFGHARCWRGGYLAEHLAAAFELETPAAGESLEEALHRQRRRWVEVSRTDGQYPVRSVWVHPRVKEGALNEFARRAGEKLHTCPTEINPEIVMLLGPPAAGKSSIGRLKPEQLEGSMKCLRKTAASLAYREEVNNDNLTDCMPGFAHEYKFALSIKETHSHARPKRLWQRARLAVKAKIGCQASRLQWMKAVHQEELTDESWALQWLTYLVYHHGPVRDSLALDIIKVTIIDAEELPVYYSSCMAGKAMGRTMFILELSGSESKPVPHKKRAFRGFWPFTSQEARFERQAGRAEDEKKEGKLKGGNLTSNLVDIHYHAQQAEINIAKMLGALHKGVKPTDEENANGEDTDVLVDHFLVIDNEGKEPKVLLDFASQEGSVDDHIQSQLRATVEEVLTRTELLSKTWDAFDPHLFRLCYFFLRKCAEKDDPLRLQAKELKAQKGLQGFQNPEEVLPLVVELDEQIFFRKYGKRSTATDTCAYRGCQDVEEPARAALAEYSEEDVDHLKKNLSVMRKYTCLAIMQFLKHEGEWEDDLIDSEEALFSRGNAA